MLSLHVRTAKCGERARKCGTTKAVRQTPTFSLCTLLRQTLRASLCCIRHISSFWSTSLENQFWEMESPDFVCLGQDGTAWSQWVVEVPRSLLPHPTSYWDSESKDIGVSILSWKQTSNIADWKQEGVWWQCVLKICPTMKYQSVLCANWKKNVFNVWCDCSVYFSKLVPCFVIFGVKCFRIKHENKVALNLPCWIISCIVWSIVL